MKYILYTLSLLITACQTQQKKSRENIIVTYEKNGQTVTDTTTLKDTAMEEMMRKMTSDPDYLPTEEEVADLRIPEQNLSTKVNANTEFIPFENIHFYREFDTLMSLVRSKNSPFYFEKLLKKFNAIPPSDFTERESAALLYGGLSHSGYQKSEVAKLEEIAAHYKDDGNFEEAIKKGRKCLQLFPLSLKANITLWFAYHSLEANDSADVYSARLEILFEGMSTSGYGQVKDRPAIALSLSATEIYCNTYAGGASFKRTSMITDDSGNTFVTYTGSFAIERFIIPKP